jgi:hypothetical protein
LRVAQPILIGKLIDYFIGQTTLEMALLYGTLLALSSFVSGMLNHMNFQETQRYGMKMRLGVCGLIYRKVNEAELCCFISGMHFKLFKDDEVEHSQ